MARAPSKKRMSAAALTPEAVRAKLSYEPDTGRLINRRTGREVRGCDQKGYLRLNVNGALVRAHRVAWVLHFGRWPNGLIDHINGNRADNRVANLREATVEQSVQNRGPRHGKKHVGITWHKRDRKWIATLMHQGKTHYIGRYDREEDAAAAYAAAALNMRGEWAWQGLHAQRMACIQGVDETANLGGAHASSIQKRDSREYGHE